jgi:hypothetical protein
MSAVRVANDKRVEVIHRTENDTKLSWQVWSIDQTFSVRDYTDDGSGKEALLDLARCTSPGQTPVGLILIIW